MNRPKGTPALKGGEKVSSHTIEGRAEYFFMRVIIFIYSFIIK
jgi:hypothetical protein